MEIDDPFKLIEEAEKLGITGLLTEEILDKLPVVMNHQKVRLKKRIFKKRKLMKWFQS